MSEPEEFLIIEPGNTIAVQAAAPPAGAPSPAKPRVIGLAYAGGAISLPGWRYPVVVDLAGLTLPETIPLLANHENRTASRVGMVKARVTGGTLEIEGEIVASGGVTEEIVAQAKAGADWQLSIGAEVKASELVRAGDKRTVNGRQHEGPFFHIRQAVLREVSVVAVGADGATRLKIAAHFILTGGPEMPGETEPTKTPVNATGNALGAPATTPPAPEPKLDAAFAQWLKDSGINAAGLGEAALAKLQLAFEAEKKPEPAAPPAKPAPEAVRAAAEPEKPAPAATPATIAAAATLTAPIPATPREPTGPSESDIRAAAIKDERERVRAIRDMCGHRAKLADEAISAGWDVDLTSRKLLAEVNSEKPQRNELAGGYKPLPADLDQKYLEAALCRRADFDEEFIAAHFGDQVADRARRGSGIGLKHLFSIAAKVGGHHGDGEFDDDMLYAALNSTRVSAGFSSFSLPGILSNVANKMMMRAFEFHTPIAKTLCRETSVSDLKEKECFRLSEVGELEELAADGEIKHGAMAEERATIAAKTWAKMYSIPRKWIINDDMGAFDGLFAGLGASAARNLDQVFFRRLMANPEGMFSAAHGNYLEGADSALTIDGLKKAREMFMLQTNIAGEPILVSPKYLLVPVALDMDASEILHSTTVIAVGAENRRRIPTDNPIARLGLTELSSPFLENPRYPGNSRKSWYLFADPNQCDTFEIVYLYGRKRPTVQTAEADFNQLGMQIRVFWDFGVKEKDHRGVVKSKGEA